MVAAAAVGTLAAAAASASPAARDATRTRHPAAFTSTSPRPSGSPCPRWQLTLRVSGLIRLPVKLPKDAQAERKPKVDEGPAARDLARPARLVLLVSSLAPIDVTALVNSCDDLHEEHGGETGLAAEYGV